jgi:hypothetical protein
MAQCNKSAKQKKRVLCVIKITTGDKNWAKSLPKSFFASHYHKNGAQNYKVNSLQKKGT